jgi:tetraacyldisaccharide 4'-kinase
LRESLSALKDVKIVIINGDKNENFERQILNVNENLEIFYSYYKPINLEKFKNKKLFVVTGIGNPENFFQLLEKNNLNIFEKKVYPDHYTFSKNEIENIIDKAKKQNCQIIMTEKDYFKINKYNLKDINYLKVSLEIDKKEKLISKVNSLYD